MKSKLLNSSIISVLAIYISCNLSSLENKVGIVKYNLVHSIKSDSLYKEIESGGDQAELAEYQKAYISLLKSLRKKYDYYFYDDCLKGKEVIKQGDIKTYKFNDEFVGAAFTYEVVSEKNMIISMIKINGVKKDTTYLSRQYEADGKQ
jgi:hypothetical protein